MQLPLFQGVSAQQLSALVEKMPFHFLKYHDGDSIITEGDTCTHIRFVVSGKVRVRMKFHSLNVQVEQTLEAPNVLAPDYLFGLETSYPFDVTAQGECGMLQLLKADYIRVIQSDKVFLFNILNYLSRNSQRFMAGMLDFKHGTVTERIALVAAVVTSQQSKQVTIKFLQKDFCTLLGTQRATLIHALETLQSEGIIDYDANQIKIINLQALRQKL